MLSGVGVDWRTCDQVHFSICGIVKSQLARPFRVIVLSEVERSRLTMAFGAD